MERAVDWLFNHPDDIGDDNTGMFERLRVYSLTKDILYLPPHFSGPAPTPQETQPKPLTSSTSLPARYRLKAFISHKGPSVHSGHYVAHIRMHVFASSNGGKEV